MFRRTVLLSNYIEGRHDAAQVSWLKSGRGLGSSTQCSSQAMSPIELFYFTRGRRVLRALCLPAVVRASIGFAREVSQTRRRRRRRRRRLRRRCHRAAPPREWGGGRCAEGVCVFVSLLSVSTVRFLTLHRPRIKERREWSAFASYAQVRARDFGHYCALVALTATRSAPPRRRTLPSWVVAYGIYLSIYLSNAARCDSARCSMWLVPYITFALPHPGWILDRT
jgi:hypothetical protein